MAVNVANIFESTIKPGNLYCRICLRTAKETTLVTPRNLRLFTDILKLNVFDNKSKDSACFMCEATAATALRMYHACVNAVSVRNVCNPLKTMKSNQSVPEWLRSAIVVCNNNLKEYRQRTTLQQTEVLVVDSAGVEWQPDKNQDPILVLAPNIPDIQQQQPCETVVVLDDDDETPALVTKRKLVPIEQMLDPTVKDKAIASLLPNQMQIISRHNVLENNYILHPLIMGVDGKVVAPSLGAYISNDTLVFDQSIFQKLPLIDCTNKNDDVTCVIENPQELAQNSTNSTNKPERDDVEEILPDRKRRGRQYGAEKSFNNTSESVLKKYLQDHSDLKKKRANIRGIGDKNKAKRRERDDTQYIVDLNMVNDMLEIKDEKEPLAVISNVTSASGTEDGLGVITQVVSRGVGLVEKSCKIDWEDKIPMDVISFVDATDPNERELIVPEPLSIHQQKSNQAPTGTHQPVVKDARQDPSTNSRPAPANRVEISVIDLC